MTQMFLVAGASNDLCETAFAVIPVTNETLLALDQLRWRMKQLEDIYQGDLVRLELLTSLPKWYSEVSVCTKNRRYKPLEAEDCELEFAAYPETQLLFKEPVVEVESSSICANDKCVWFTASIKHGKHDQSFSTCALTWAEITAVRAKHEEKKDEPCRDVGKSQAAGQKS